MSNHDISVGKILARTVDFISQNRRIFFRSFAVPIVILLALYFIFALSNGDSRPARIIAPLNFPWFLFFIGSLTSILSILYVCAFVNVIQVVGSGRSFNAWYRFRVGSTELLALGIFYIGIIVLLPLNSLAFSFSEVVAATLPTPRSVGPDFIPWAIRMAFHLVALSVVVGLFGLPFAQTVRTSNFDFDQSMILSRQHGWKVAITLFTIGVVPLVFIVFWRISVGVPDANDMDFSNLFANWILVIAQTFTPLIYVVPYIVIGSLVIAAESILIESKDV